jgi:hypothetical protein
MSERRELTEFERGQIIGAWKFGHSEREIEETLATQSPQYMTRLKDIVKPAL